ncbi:WD40 repeat domain-containing protein, partial [Dapis sp. BLCC M229]|uniref:WD40 repeat domain-containing protein n=1 Tax=Dapis sp. BLCC M229 TaxID=3400188 RepID=UPI003CEFD6EB
MTEKFVEDLAEELGEIRPIELQVMGAQLQRENITTLKKYQELGDNPKAQLVERYLASVVRDCGAENQKLAWLILMLFTDENNTRPLKTQAELVKESEFSAEELELVLKIFVDSGLVFLLPQNPVEQYQLVHDYLVGFIRRRKGNETLEELKQEREKRREEQEKRLQLQKRLVIVSVAASLVMAVLAGVMTKFALNEQSEGKKSEKRTAIARANEARALSTSGERWDSLTSAMNGRQRQINGKFQPTGEDGSTITNALRVAVYKRNKQEEYRERNHLDDHENSVLSVAFSLDGKTIATASDDKTVKLWNRQGELLQTLTGHENSVLSVAFSPDGEIIATAGYKTVKLWNPQGELLQTLTGHEAWVRSIAFNPDGKTIATASDDKTVKLWNRQGELLQTLTGHENSVLSVAFSPDGESIATASYKTVKLWNRQGELLQTLTG